MQDVMLLALQRALQRTIAINCVYKTWLAGAEPHPIIGNTHVSATDICNESLGRTGKANVRPSRQVTKARLLQ